LFDAYVRVVTQSPTPLDGAYCNALLLADLSLRQQEGQLSLRETTVLGVEVRPRSMIFMSSEKAYAISYK